jgi:hypothetical protein
MADHFQAMTERGSGRGRERESERKSRERERSFIDNQIDD